MQGSGDTSQAADGNSDRTDEKADREQISSDNDNRNREPANQGDDNSSLKEQEDIDIVLLKGSGFEGGKKRIIDFYFKESSNTERAKFLKDEYGIGGGSVTYSNNVSGFADHDGKGITLRNRYLESEPLHLTWSKAAKRIGQLIENERYYEPRYANDKPLIKPIIDTNIETKGADEAPFSLEENEPDITVEPKRKRRTQAEMNYSRLQELAPHIMDKRYRYANLKSDGYMDLTIEWISDNRIAISHYGEQNGDSMADPDMELIVDFDKQTLMPASYQNDYVNVYQQVYLDNNQWNPKLSKELTSFLSTWLRNIEF